MYKAQNRKDRQQLVALKLINTQEEKQGFPITAIREIMILQNLVHPNVINLIGVTTKEIK